MASGAGSRAAGGALLSNLVRFARLLARLGLGGSPATAIDMARALSHVEVGRRGDVYHALRALAVRRREEIPTFDRAFEVFWRAPRRGSTELDLRALGEERRLRREPAGPLAGEGPDDDGRSSRSQSRVPLRARASSGERLRTKRFDEMTGEELAEIGRLLSAMRWRLGERRTRRRRPAKRGGNEIDLRRTFRDSVRRGGETLDWRRRRRRSEPRPLVVLADVSGSMERTTRVVLLFLYALARGLPQRVETFLFGTRLTRVTRALAGRDVELALAEVGRAVPDWSGGTRIGEALKRFNFDWARRVLPSGAVVLLVTDGWDRGEPALLAREMARLQRGCHRLIWLNPLLGEADYQPTARGVRAALPYTDDFLPLHDFATLTALGRRLESLDDRRSLRRTRSGP